MLFGPDVREWLSDAHPSHFISVGQDQRRYLSKAKDDYEPVFGQLKEARKFRNFLLRGSENVRGKYVGKRQLMALCHNLGKLQKSRA